MRNDRAGWRAITCSLVFVALLAGCDFFNTGFEDVEAARLYEAREKQNAPADPDKLLVMNWNIKFAGGRIDFFFDCYGPRVLMSRQEVHGHLEGLARKINQVNPDILLLQEIDILSKRTAYVDMVQWLLDQTGLNYGAYASQWKADFIPSDGLGRVDDGIAILSRWPIQEATRIALPGRSDQSAITEYFYLKRALLSAHVPLPGSPSLRVINTHFEAFTQDDTKKRQLAVLMDELRRLDDGGALFVMGGDLNMIPPGSVRVKDFPDSVCEAEAFQADDYSEEVGWIDPLYAAYRPAIPLADYQANNAPYFSHTTDKNGFWNRKLDYIFTNGEWLPGSGLTHQDAASGGMETMPLSDHAPLTAILQVRR
jgi:endonuclease/exonuclease/phosphatase family metal-dependent hydrolase